MPAISESSPLHTPNRFYSAGRGGAGNYHLLSSTPSSPLPPTVISQPSSNTKHAKSYYFNGRGGVGNLHYSGEREIFSFDEELERDRLFHQHHAPVYSIGRGGAGNIVPSDEIATRSHYTESFRPSFDYRECHQKSRASSLASSNHSAIHFSSAGLKSGADRMLERLVNRTRQESSPSPSPPSSST
jgi:hypothetical protein